MSEGHGVDLDAPCPSLTRRVGIETDQTMLSAESETLPLGPLARALALRACKTAQQNGNWVFTKETHPFNPVILSKN